MHADPVDVHLHVHALHRPGRRWLARTREGAEGSSHFVRHVYAAPHCAGQSPLNVWCMLLEGHHPSIMRHRLGTYIAAVLLPIHGFDATILVARVVTFRLDLFRIRLSVYLNLACHTQYSTRTMRKYGTCTLTPTSAFECRSGLDLKFMCQLGRGMLFKQLSEWRTKMHASGVSLRRCPMYAECGLTMSCHQQPFRSDVSSMCRE